MTMQDRFKSRFFHKPSGKYLNSHSLVYCNGCYEHVADRQSPNGTYKAYILATYNTSEIIEEQCTGLKDKNGKLIYEGDIIRCSYGNEYYIGLVVWDSEEIQFSMEVDKELYSFSQHSEHEKIEVIGNIHNPDLLENKDE